MPVRDPSAGHPTLETTIVRVLAVGVAGLAAPALLAGAAGAELLRRRGLRWTWWVMPALLGLLGCVVLGPGVVGSAPAWIATRDAMAALRGLTGVWVSLAPVCALVWHAWRDRRDRMHGGEVERRSRAARGPLATLALHRATRLTQSATISSTIS